MATTIVEVRRPLCVDMDGTLLATDILWESVVLLARKRPHKLALLPLWVVRGKAFFKRRLAQEVLPDAGSLPYREDVLSFLQVEHSAGRELVLATASDASVAQAVAEHLGLFSAVVASDGVTNRSGASKLEALKAHCGENRFDYIGNSRADLPLWRAAEGAILVDPSPFLLRSAAQGATIQQVMRTPSSRAYALLRALRVHQWVKNLLLFVPVLLGHKMGDPAVLLTAVYAFIAFSLCASSVYITNDLLDLDADRAHPRKRKRPFASGALQIPTGIALAPLLLAGGFATSIALLPAAFTATLAIYFVLTTIYSTILKRVLLLDVFMLAGLYTLRVLAGGVATAIVISPWLAAFSLFFFTSLAFLKRYSELRLLQEKQQTRSQRRDYNVADMDLVRSIGPASGYVSVLVLALYTNSAEVLELYTRPMLLWAVMPVLLYWVTRVWFLAHRGQVADDPIVFTVKDPTSYVVGALAAIFIVLASV